MQIQKPSFFKILLGDFATVLRLPLLFVEVYGERLSPTVSLATGASPEKSWAVKVEKSGDHWVLGDGWSAFVKGNRLEAGDFAIFWMMDNWSTFKVRLYDCTCCDKQLSSRFFSPGGFPGELDERSTKIDVDVNVKEEIKTEDEFETSSDGPSLVHTTNLSFTVILPAYHGEEMVKMIMPKRFVEKTGIATKRYIPLKDETGRTWRIEIHKEHGEFLMHGEWADFYAVNRLAKGYVCRFELVAGSGGDQLLQFHVKKKTRGRPGGRKMKTRSSCQGLAAAKMVSAFVV
ncbi:unnamed protein product [Cuscuta campestris]|uniref:TF-B3 domain-containing protein n=1 Tax=Cuscuta campestris TaxID=132261 RepID=A0A484MCI7_9ASTE|nr:unnamed protein product [Cuscuta campestris]